MSADNRNKGNVQSPAGGPMMGRPGGRRGPMGGGPMGFGAPVQKAKNFKGSLKRLLGYLKPHRINLIIVLIFAIAGTTFGIFTPKISGKAINKLQDSYMARKMLSSMSEAQDKAVNQLYDKMSDAQKKAVDAIDTQMADGQVKAVDQITGSMTDAQVKAVDQITKQMGDAQVKAVDAIYDGMAAQIYNGVVTGQKTAVSTMYTQMAAAQKQVVAQITAMMQPGAVQPGGSTQQMDPSVIKAVSDLMKLPAIDTIQDPVIKKNTVISFMDLLQKLPFNGTVNGNQTAGQMDQGMLKTADAMLKLPMLGTVTDPSQKETVVRQFLKLSASMPAGQGSTAQGASSMQLDKATMDKVLARIPYLESTTQSTKTNTKMSEDAAKAVQDLLKLPLINNIQSPQEKKDTLVSLIGIFKRMPDMSASSTTQTGSSIDPKALDSIPDLLALPDLNTVADPQQKLDNTLKLIDIFKAMPSVGTTTETTASDTKMDPASLATVQELLKLPKISDIKDPQQRVDTVIKMVDLFQKMPEMPGSDSGSTSTDMTFDPNSIGAIKDLLKLPVISSISDPREKSAAVVQLLDVFSKMPADSSVNATSDSNAQQMSPEALKDIKEFLALPRIGTLTDANQKADVVKKFIDLGKKMQGTMTGAPANPEGSVKLTEDQINGAIEAIRETNGQYDFKYIGWIAILLICIYIISSGFSLAMGLVMSGVSQRTVRDLRNEVNRKLNRLPLKYFDMHPHGDILSRVTNDIDTIATTLQQSLTQIITSIIQILGFLIMMLTISPVMTLIVIATLPLYIVATTLIAKKSQKFFAAQQKELGLLSGHVEEMYTGHKIVKAFGQEKNSIEKFEGINDKLYNAGWKAQFVSGIMFPLMNFISNLGYVLICVVGGIWITLNRLKIGDMLAFIQYTRQFTMPIVQTANIANVIQSTVACAERVFEVLDEEEEVPELPDAKVIEYPKGEVRFKNVDFRYTEEVPLIENMNLDVKRGETIAIVGPTGAGKTTLVNLLMRFYELNSGVITVDGVDIKDMKRSNLRKMFGMVLQDTWLFNGTIKDNIAYGREDASMEDIKRAAKAAHADHFIRTLPEGYDTVLNEEATNISQGQKQLLTIARAILADPAVLILDEATSSVDTRTEVLIQKAMANLMKDRTSFVIAHRLSTIRDAEMILVMNKGSIIEQGNHKQLLEKNGFYADLYNSQFSGANLEDGKAG